MKLWKNKFSYATKRILLMASLGLMHTVAMAQNNTGAAGIGQAANIFKSYLDPVQKLLYAVAAIIALIGAFSVFTKMQNGDQDVKKTIMMVVGGCVALVAMAAALPSFFQ